MARLKNAQVLYFQPPEGRWGGAWREPGRQVRPNVELFTLPPMASPDAPGFLLERDRRRRTQLLREVLRSRRCREPLLWCDDPSGAGVVDELPWRGIVYDCARDRTGAPVSWERELAARADVVFAASPELLRKMGGMSANVALLPYGCSAPMFLREDLTPPEALRRLPRPVLGHAGTIWADLDLSPVTAAARAHPEWTFLLAGREEGNPLLPELRSLPNVRTLGFVEPGDLPEVLSAFDVCLHLRRRRQGDVLSPRIFEYLSTGKPTVAMLEPGQVELFPDVVYAAHDGAEFRRVCAAALREEDPYLARRRREYGKAAAWSLRAAAVEAVLEDIGLF